MRKLHPLDKKVISLVSEPFVEHSTWVGQLVASNHLELVRVGKSMEMVIPYMSIIVWRYETLGK